MNLKRKDLDSCLSRTCLIYSITLQYWTWKQLIKLTYLHTADDVMWWE